jgi:DNA-binding HxlR family transcriptional regulator
MQPARGDARGCLALALPIPRDGKAIRLRNARADASRAGFFMGASVPCMLFSAPPRHRLLRDNARNSRALRDAGRQPEKRGKGMNEPLSDHVMRGDVMSEHCPSREVLKHVTSRWGVLLLVALGDGTQRFGELRRKVGGISERMLIQTLQWLEQDGFVQRTAHAGSSGRIPPDAAGPGDQRPAAGSGRLDRTQPRRHPGREQRPAPGAGARLEPARHEKTPERRRCGVR